MQAEFSDKPKKHRDRGWTITFIILSIAIIGAVFYTGGIIPQVAKMSFLPDREGIPVPKDYKDKDSNLQLDTLVFTTATPIPSQTCSEATAVDLVVDTSGSMNYGQKLQDLKTALTVFTENLSDNSIIGLQTFNSQFTPRVQMSPYSQVKPQLKATIDNLSANGATYTRDAFEGVKPILASAKTQYPNRKLYLIFVTDGIPESYEYSIKCNQEYSSNNGNLTGDCADNCALVNDPIANARMLRCYSPDQDPTIPPDLAQEIKDMDVTIYTIALLDGQDAQFNTKLNNLMRKAATSPETFKIAPNSDDLIQIYRSIVFELCN